jgi:hypothetical protein
MVDFDLAGHSAAPPVDEADGVGRNDCGARASSAGREIGGKTHHDERCRGERDCGASARHEPSSGDGLGQRNGVRIDLVGARRGEFARQVRRDQLIQALGPIEVLQSVLAEIGDPDVIGEVVLDERPRDAGHQDLSAVRRGRDSRRPVHAESHVAVGTHGRLARVQPHPHPHRFTVRPRLRRERALPGDCRGSRRRRARKGREERVALRVHHLAAVPLDCVAQDPLVLGEDVAVPAAEPRQQRGRSLDVREQEGDCPGRQLSHWAWMDRTPVQLFEQSAGAQTGVQAGRSTATSTGSVGYRTL